MLFQHSKSFNIAHIRHHTATSNSNSFNFNKTGDLLLATQDSKVALIDSNSAKFKHSFDLQDSFAGNSAIFTHHNNCILFDRINNKNENFIDYYSFYGPRTIRRFSTVGKRTKMLNLCPSRDFFLSSELGGNIKLWDFGTGKCEAVVDTKEIEPVISFDPEGLVFAVGGGGGIVKLYDARNFKDGSFLVFKTWGEEKLNMTKFTALEITQDGKKIVLRNNRNKIFVCDAFDGKLLSKMVVPINKIVRGTTPQQCNLNLSNSPTKSNTLNISISGNDKYVAASSHEGIIYTWDISQIEPRRPTKMFSGGIEQFDVRFNPVQAMMATFGSKLDLLLPDEGLSQQTTETTPTNNTSFE